MSVRVASRHVAATRRFNRFYTQRIGVLEEGLAESDYTLAEARVLYELAHRDSVTAIVLSRDLGLDQGYLSRILARFGKAGLVARTRSAVDGRARPIALTPRGRRTFAGLNEATERQISGLVSPLPAARRDELVLAMEKIEALLGGKDTQPAPPILRPPKPGELGWVVSRHGALYAEEYGFDQTFEILVAGIVADFARNHDPAREQVWIAEYDGRPVGSIFLVRGTDTEAKLRLLFVEPAARGLGIGQKLVTACVDQARACGYRALTLWTQNNLVSARRIYQAAGFALAREEPHQSFGKDLVGQTWRLDL